jgi:hypothetical protein
VDRQEPGHYRLSCADSREFVDLYTRQIMNGTIFLEGLDEDAVEGELYSLQLDHPNGEGVLTLPGKVAQVQRGTPKGVKVSVSPIAAETRATLESCVTALLRGTAPRAWPAPAKASAAASANGTNGAGAVHGTDPLSELSLEKRIQLAAGGSQAARAWLLRDAQSEVLASLVTNPRITPPEIAEIAKNPRAGMQAMARIAAKPELMNDNGICLHVVSNPSTDPMLAQKFLPRLTVPQLCQLAKSQRVRANIRSGALRLLLARQGQGQK